MPTTPEPSSTFPAALAITVPALGATGAATVFHGACTLIGGSIVGGATAGTVKVYDALQASEPMVATGAFTANGSVELLGSVPGVKCVRGVTVFATKATAESVVYIIPTR